MYKHILAVIAAAVVLIQPALAATPPSPSGTPQPLTAEQEQALRDFAASLAVSPPNVEIRAELTPPRTAYAVQFSGEDYKNIHDRFKTWSDSSGKAYATGTTGFPFAQTWHAELGCGTWDAKSHVWSHPDGTPPTGCPHEQGTSHPGTITAAGTYNVSVSLAKVLNVASQSGGVYMVAKFEFVCRYEGSESGTAPCEEQLVSMTGRDGTYQASSSIRWPVIAAIIAASVAALAYAFRSRLRTLVSR